MKRCLEWLNSILAFQPILRLSLRPAIGLSKSGVYGEAKVQSPYYLVETCPEAIAVAPFSRATEMSSHPKILAFRSL